MKINIRSITLGLNWADGHMADIEYMLADFFSKAKKLMNENQIGVRTHRLAISPINYGACYSSFSVNNTLSWISSLCRKDNIRWYCVPFDLVNSKNLTLDFEIVRNILARHPEVFLNFIIAKNNTISTQASLVGAKIVKYASLQTANGFDNFRIGLSANCIPNTPFFPFTYHEGKNGFSIALELPNLFLDVIQNAKDKSLDNIRALLLENSIENIRNINHLARNLSEITELEYKGIDVSLAPLPDEENSVAKIVEALGVNSFGANGTLFFTAYLKNILNTILKLGNIKPVGFNGVMYSLLEDPIVCKNSNYKMFDINALMAFASVCGCGVDMVPITGDAGEEEIASLALDLSAMSTVLKKPLGVRVLPIPLKGVNEKTDFNHDFIHNAKVNYISNRACNLDIFKNDNFSYL